MCKTLYNTSEALARAIRLRRARKQQARSSVIFHSANPYPSEWSQPKKHRTLEHRGYILYFRPAFGPSEWYRDVLAHVRPTTLAARLTSFLLWFVTGLPQCRVETERLGYIMAAMPPSGSE